VKGKSFYHRFRFALAGWRVAFQKEASFRVQVFAAVGTIAVTTWLNPPAIWMALVIVMVVLVLAAELFNTALEHLLDGLHPQQAEFVRIAKDCSAAAVLLFSITSVVVFALMVLVVLGYY
jgi:diacylglycerol kinase